jgi:hypothetical protein
MPLLAKIGRRRWEGLLQWISESGYKGRGKLCAAGLVKWF